MLLKQLESAACPSCSPIIAACFMFSSPPGTAQIILLSIVTISVTLLGMYAIAQWRRVRIIELEIEFRRMLLDQKLSVDEIEWLLSMRAHQRKGVIEQFGSLHWGVKIGLIIAWFITIVMIATTVQHYCFWVLRA